jgi:hypothetical protein
VSATSFLTLLGINTLSLCSPGMDSTSDADGPESEEDGVEENPYPLDGKYIDEYDRQRYTATFVHRLSSQLTIQQPPRNARDRTRRSARATP